MTTTMPTFAGFPTVRRASYLALSAGLNRIATSAGTSRRAGLPVWPPQGSLGSGYQGCLVDPSDGQHQLHRKIEISTKKECVGTGLADPDFV
ncbi:hypothetical protein [Yoonia sp.]|jgi:hypothetical protein|uniref:hypothetical protein n=1 Tax=Yoonia sp. TaxID=2212373 RepID=UPI001BCEBB09|nr:hypothetical protein [Yoonia sp.]